MPAGSRDESDWQHHSVDPALPAQLRAMPVAKVPVMSPAPDQGQPHPGASGLALLVEMSPYPVGQGCPLWAMLPAQTGLFLSLLYAGGLRRLRELHTGSVPKLGQLYTKRTAYPHTAKNTFCSCCSLTPAGNLTITQPLSPSHCPRPQWGGESKREGKLCGLK